MNELQQSEFRGGWLGAPRKFELIDLMGAGLGAYMIYLSTNRNRYPWLTAALGGTMVFIHVQRFFYAPQTRAGLVNLMRSLDMSPADALAAAVELEKGRIENG